MPLYNPLSSTDTIGQSYEISNLGLATSVAASALTIALKQADGTTDPGAGASAVKVGMRSSTLTSGLYNQRSVATATSLVISSGSTLGHTSGNAHKIWVYLIDNAGTLELAASQTLYPETQLISTTAEGGAGAADSNRVIYSATARSSVPHRVIGLLTSTQTTAGTWATNMSQVQVGNYGGLSATEVVAARYTTAAGQSIPNTATSTIIDFGTKDYDTHNAVTTGASWKFTAPIAGFYRVTSMNAFSSALAWTAGNAAYGSILKNGSTNVGMIDDPPIWASVTDLIPIKGTNTVYLLAGEYIDIRLANNRTGGNSALQANADYNYVTIERIK